jgi:putative transcriptional regulator
MTSLFDDLKEGLQEAIAFAKGEGPARITRFEIEPVKKFSNTDIRRIRMNAEMTQAVFALYMGVSVKTVEAWENGRTHPTGPACRLLKILAEGKEQPDFIFQRKEYQTENDEKAIRSGTEINKEEKGSLTWENLKNQASQEESSGIIKQDDNNHPGQVIDRDEQRKTTSMAFTPNAEGDAAA